MKNGYKIDFAKNTITVNYKFAAAINKYGSEAYNTNTIIIIQLVFIKIL